MERLTGRFTNGEAYCKNITHASTNNVDNRTFVEHAIEKLADYEDAEEQGLLYRKVWMIECFCHKPSDCDGDCEYCHMNELEVNEEIIKCSDFDETKHYNTKEEAENKLASMQKGE